MKNKDIKLVDLDQKLYKSFFSKADYSTPFHSLDFLISISSVRTDLELYFNIIYDDEFVYGIMPYFKVKKIPFSMITLPYGCYGGYMFINKNNLKKYLKLDNPFKLITTIVSYNNNDIYNSCKFYCKIESTWILEISDNYENIFKKLHTKTRNQIRKAYKEKIEIFDIKTNDELDEIKKIYSELVIKHNIKKPYSDYLFDKLYEKSIYSDNILFKIAKKDKNIIAFSIFLRNVESIFYWLNASSSKYLKYNGTNAILDNVLKLACESNCKELNMGAVPLGNNGLEHFKNRWNAKKVEYKTYSSFLYNLLRKIK